MVSFKRLNIAQIVLFVVILVGVVFFAPEGNACCSKKTAHVRAESFFSTVLSQLFKPCCPDQNFCHCMHDCHNKKALEKPLTIDRHNINIFALSGTYTTLFYSNQRR